jgi:hypothetical protein
MCIVVHRPSVDAERLVKLISEIILGVRLVVYLVAERTLNWRMKYCQ